MSGAYLSWNATDPIVHLPLKVTIDDAEASVAMDAEGKRLFVINVPRSDGSDNRTIDPRSGRSVVRFEGKYWGVAVSADDKLLALGGRDSVRLFTLD